MGDGVIHERRGVSRLSPDDPGPMATGALAVLLARVTGDLVERVQEAIRLKGGLVELDEGSARPRLAVLHPGDVARTAAEGLRGLRGAPTVDLADLAHRPAEDRRRLSRNEVRMLLRA